MIYISHLMSDEDMCTLLEEASLGVESIEFSIGYCLDKWQESLDSYRHRLEAMNYQSLSVHGPFLDLNPSSNDTLIRKVTRERFQQAYDAAVALKADKIIYHTCFVPRVNFLEGWTDLIVPFWEEFLADKDEGIQIHLENVFDPVYELIWEVVERVNHPAFSICLDLGHANHASKFPVTEWIERLGPRIGHIHIHDNNGIRDEHLAVGDGIIDWDKVGPALRHHCPNASYTIENSRLEDARKTLRFLLENAPAHG